MIEAVGQKALITPGIGLTSGTSRTIGRLVARRKSFYLQYISLMLIIATLVIGAFLRGPTGTSDVIAGPTAPAIPRRVPPKMVLVANLEYQDLFQETQAVLNTEQAEVLKQVLKSHDLSVVVTTFAPLEKDLDFNSNATLALERSTVLFRFLIDAGIPPEAVQSRGSLEPSAVQTKLQLFREESADE